MTPPPALSPRMALFLDLDGTLAPIAAHPDDVAFDEPRAAALEAALARLDGAVAVISGRAIDTIDRILRGQIRAVAGVHGLERRRADGARAAVAVSSGLDAARPHAQAFAAERPGLFVEDKGLALALHFRAAPAFEAEALAAAARIARLCGLTLQPGDMVAEMRAPGADKGAAVAAFLAEPPFAGRTPVFVGDDLTDEAGFAAAAKAGGYGVRVGDRPLRGAQFHLADPAAVRAWLQDAAP